MKSRLAESIPTLPFQGDEYRLLATAKVLAFSFLAMLGVVPWTFGESGGIRTLRHDAVSEGSLKFVVDGLLACLDCHCDQGARGNISIMSCLCAYIAVAYVLACQKLEASRTDQEAKSIVPAIKAIGMCSSTIMARTFKRCFSIVTGDVVHGMECDICLRSLLAALRGAALLTGLVRAEAQKPVTARVNHQMETSAADEFNGGIDDDAIANMDLDILEHGCIREDVTLQTKQLLSFLCSALFTARVSVISGFFFLGVQTKH